MCLVDQEADSKEDQADHELDDQLLPYKLKPAVKADIDHSQGHQDQANWGDQADVALPPVVGIDHAGPVDAEASFYLPLRGFLGKKAGKVN